MKTLNDLDMNQNQIKNSVFENLSQAPSNPKVGQHYFNTTDKKLYLYNGTEWVESGSSAVAGCTTQATSLTCTLPDNL